MRTRIGALVGGIIRDEKGLFHQGTSCIFSPQWDPEDVNLERNKDNMQMLRSQVHKWSVKPVDLTSDE